MIKIFFCNEVCYVFFFFFGIMFSYISCSNSVINNDKKESIIRTIQEELTLHPKAYPSCEVHLLGMKSFC
jgi:hypothetical protein